MAASYPGAIKNFLVLEDGVDKVIAAHPNDRAAEITAIETELGINPRGSMADVKTRLAVALNDDGTIKAAAVITTMLKTATGEVSSTTNRSELVLPGGEYGFYPQIKMSQAEAHIYEAQIVGRANDSISGWTSYETHIQLSTDYGTIYARQRYVTASGQDYWLFLLIDKITKDVIGGYSAPDHPAYGNGGDFDKMPHPFSSYDPNTQEIILVDNDSITELKAQVTSDKSLLTLVNESYKLHHEEQKYKPLHSGQFIDKTPVLVKSIPNYIKVKKLIKGGVKLCL